MKSGLAASYFRGSASLSTWRSCPEPTLSLRVRSVGGPARALVTDDRHGVLSIKIKRRKVNRSSQGQSTTGDVNPANCRQTGPFYVLYHSPLSVFFHVWTPTQTAIWLPVLERVRRRTLTGCSPVLARRHGTLSLLAAHRNGALDSLLWPLRYPCTSRLTPHVRPLPR